MCEVFALENPRSSLALLDEDEKGVHIIDTPGGEQEMLTISEQGLYFFLLDEDEKGYFRISEVRSDGIAQARKYVIISESGLYALVFRSHKPEARAFSKWVRGEVLPTFRQNGFVGTPPQSRVGPCRA